jgi:hypothetical protein
MSSSYVLATSANGPILAAGTVTSDYQVAQQSTSGYTAYAGVGTPQTHYMLNGAITTRPDLASLATVTNVGGWTANGTDVYSYGTTLPNPTTVTIRANGTAGYALSPVAAFNVTDGTLNLTTTMPGDYVITLDAFPYATKTLMVTAS